MKNNYENREREKNDKLKLRTMNIHNKNNVGSYVHADVHLIYFNLNK